MSATSNVTFEVWDELKRFAQEYAQTDKALPSDEECNAWFQSMLDKFHLTDVRADAFDYYATELCSLITDYRNRRPRQPARTGVA